MAWRNVEQANLAQDYDSTSFGTSLFLGRSVLTRIWPVHRDVDAKVCADPARFRDPDFDA